MTRQIKNILKGIGSVIDIAPNTRFQRYVPKQTPSERINSSWVRVGKNIQNAIGNVADGQEYEKNKS